MSTHYRQRLPDSGYFVIGLVEHTSHSKQGIIEYRWTWLCQDPQAQFVLLTEIYDLFLWSSRDPSPSSLTEEHLCEVTKKVLEQDEAASYLNKLKHVCERTLPLPIFVRFSQDEKAVLSS